MGQDCPLKLTSEEECKKAAKEVYAGLKRAKVTYGRIKMSEASLPRGCIFDERVPFLPYVYWNMKGKHKSQNKNIRTMCKSAPYSNLNPDPLSQIGKFNIHCNFQAVIYV